MRIPKRLKVGGHLYQVTVGHQFRENDNLVGQARKVEGLILLATHVPGGAPCLRSQIEETFVHELLHIVNSIYNADGLDEKTVTRLSEGLYQVLTDNRMLR